jgi:hypothetical protein
LRFLLTPGFSPVQSRNTKKTVSTVSGETKAVETTRAQLCSHTRLKPGVNEMSKKDDLFL